MAEGKAAHLHTQKCTGHGCYPARPNVEASPDVFANNLGWHRLGDEWAIHCCVDCHDGHLATSSNTVFANNKGVARIGDDVDCGSKCLEGSNNVFAGD